MKAAEAYTEEKQGQRRHYWDEIKEVEAENLVFLDETGVNLAMVSLYGRAVRGQRAYGQRPLKKGKNVSLIGAMTLNDGFLTGFSFEGGTNGETFLWFIEEVLAPQLWSGAVVVMDNLPAHKVEGVIEAIQAVGASVVYLSPYSPDFNPIEHLWSKLKAHLRSVAARTREALHDALRDGLNLITLEDVRHWFTHCCYCT
ncbi:MAG: IS630 family transposase [Pleurocapsa sp. MO_192.B19]|nr:IS630 family transposase [Pleurocapsa sp. MO_192.B19]